MSIVTPFVNGELTPDKRCGHISVFYKGLFVVFGGYGERNANDDGYLISNHLWCYNLEASQWTRYTTKGDHPGNTTGSCATLMGNRLYLFAGFHQNDGHTNRLYSLDLSTLEWRDCVEDEEGFRPSPRDKFGCWKHNRTIVYFGGFGNPPHSSVTKGEFYFEELPDNYSRGFGWNNQLYTLEVGDKLTWSQPDVSGDIPCPRAAFAYTQIGNRGYLLGGRFRDDRRNDMYSIDLDTYTWTHVKSPPLAPCGRSWHIMVPVSEQHLFIYGGLDSQGSALKDVWVFDNIQEIWGELPNATNFLGCFAPRLWHTACPTDAAGEIIIFGGCSNSVFGSEQAMHTNTIATFRYSPLSLQRLCLDMIMRNYEKYQGAVDCLPRPLQRRITYRCNALGLNGSKGHGKLVNNTCQVM
jgi:hypothetical protein